MLKSMIQRVTMSSDKSNGNKRRRKEEQVGSSSSSSSCENSHHQEVLDFLLSKLSLTDDDPKQSKQKSFSKEVRQLEKDQQLLQALQESIQTLQTQVEQKQVATYQHYSIFNARMDQGLRNHILSFLDEEGVWVLEASTMMQLEENRLMNKWKRLWEKRNHAFPDVLAEVVDFYTDNEESDTELEQERRDRFKTYGEMFGKASRMARRMEAMAQTQYNTNFDVPNNSTSNLSSWPTHTCKTMRVDRMDNAFFVRISYRYDDQKSPLVLEGFTELPYWTIKDQPGHSEAVLEFSCVNEEVIEVLYNSLNQVYNQEYEVNDYAQYHQELLQAKRQLGNRLAITILEMKICMTNPDMKLVVSTTGYSTEDGEYIYLTPRSPNFQQNAAVGDDCIRVGFELETEGQSIKIQLTG